MEIQRANAALDGALTSMQAERADQSRRDEQTAKVLGYTDELARNNDMARFAGSDRFNILINEVQEPRYYVVVTAYDFDEITNQKKKKRKPDPEWITRFSIRTRGNDFMDRIDDMAENRVVSFANARVKSRSGTCRSSKRTPLRSKKKIKPEPRIHIGQSSPDARRRNHPLRGVCEPES